MSEIITYEWDGFRWSSLSSLSKVGFLIDALDGEEWRTALEVKEFLLKANVHTLPSYDTIAKWLNSMTEDEALVDKKKPGQYTEYRLTEYGLTRRLEY